MFFVCWFVTAFTGVFRDVHIVGGTLKASGVSEWECRQLCLDEHLDDCSAIDYDPELDGQCYILPKQLACLDPEPDHDVIHIKRRQCGNCHSIYF